MKKRINLITPNTNKRLLIYLGLDILLLLIIAFTISFIFSYRYINDTYAEQKVLNYENKQISILSNKTKDYDTLKRKKNNTLKIAKSYVQVQEYEYMIIHGLEKISSIIPKNLLVTNLKYDILNKKNNIILNGKTTNLELISAFLEKLKTVFPKCKIHLERLDAIKQNSKNRVFTITIIENSNKKPSKKVSS